MVSAKKKSVLFTKGSSPSGNQPPTCRFVYIVVKANKKKILFKNSAPACDFFNSPTEERQLLSSSKAILLLPVHDPGPSTSTSIATPHILNKNVSNVLIIALFFSSSFHYVFVCLFVGRKSAMIYSVTVHRIKNIQLSKPLLSHYVLHVI